MSSPVGREFPEIGHEVCTDGRPGGKMPSAQVRDASARHLDDEEKA
jgi:hypothetical protein